MTTGRPNGRSRMGQFRSIPTRATIRIQCGVVNHVATAETAVVRRNALTLRSHVRAGCGAVNQRPVVDRQSHL